MMKFEQEGATIKADMADTCIKTAGPESNAFYDIFKLTTDSKHQIIQTTNVNSS